jgi:hypothetical protein
MTGSGTAPNVTASVKRIRTRTETFYLVGLKSRHPMKRTIFIHWTMELMFPGIISRPINMASRTCPFWTLGVGRHQSGILLDSNNLLIRR